MRHHVQFSSCQQHLQIRKNRIGTLLALYIYIQEGMALEPTQGRGRWECLAGMSCGKAVLHGVDVD